MKLRPTYAAVALSLLAAACGGSQPPAEPPPPVEAPADSTDTGAEPLPQAEAEDPAPEPEVDLSQIAFDEMTEPQKKKYMKEVVVPAMQQHFQSFDAEEFAKVSCVTCHGEGAKEGKFEMPNPELPKLDPANQFAKEKKAHPKMLEFMMQTVSPEMAKLLKRPPFDPKTGKGFGCFGCHTHE